MAMR
jgi:hypothetical protein